VVVLDGPRLCASRRLSSGGSGGADPKLIAAFGSLDGLAKMDRAIQALGTHRRPNAQVSGTG